MRSQGAIVRSAVLLGAGVCALMLPGCGPDFTIECAEGAPVIDGDPFSCDRCFVALGCDAPVDGVADCPSGVTGGCSADVAAREYCCDGDCVTCP